MPPFALCSCLLIIRQLLPHVTFSSLLVSSLDCLLSHPGLNTKDFFYSFHRLWWLVLMVISNIFTFTCIHLLYIYIYFAFITLYFVLYFLCIINNNNKNVNVKRCCEVYSTIALGVMTNLTLFSLLTAVINLFPFFPLFESRETTIMEFFLCSQNK